jgi:hypothetical protein
LYFRQHLGQHFTSAYENLRGEWVGWAQARTVVAAIFPSNVIAYLSTDRGRRMVVK